MFGCSHSQTLLNVTDVYDVSSEERFLKRNTYNSTAPDTCTWSSVTFFCHSVTFRTRAIMILL